MPSEPVGVELDAGLAAHPSDVTGANVKPEVAIAEGINKKCLVPTPLSCFQVVVINKTLSDRLFEYELAGSDPFSVIDGVVSVPEKIVMAKSDANSSGKQPAHPRLSALTGASLQQIQDFNASARTPDIPFPAKVPAEPLVPEGLLLP